MNALNKHSLTRALPIGLWVIASLGQGFAQTLINLSSQGRNIDFTSAPWTRPVKTGTTVPTTCSTGDLFFNTGSSAGQNLYACPTPNAWVLIGSGLTDPGTNGLVLRTGANATKSVTAPAGAVVGTTDTQTLTNKSIDASEITSGTLTVSRLPNLLPDPGANGIVQRTALNTTTVITPPAGTIVGTTDTQTLSNKSIDASEITTGIFNAARLPALLGDPGANGVVERTALDTTAVVAAPVGAIVGTSDTQTLTNKSIDASEITSGVIGAARLPNFLPDPGANGILQRTAPNTTAVIAGPSGAIVGTTDTQTLTNKNIDASEITSGVINTARLPNFLTDPGANGIVQRTGLNTTTVIAGPSGAIVGTTDTQTLSNKSIDASEIASGTLAAGRLPAITGDVSTAAGSTSATLATVNASPGTYGDATHSVQVTVDAKGRVTSIAPVGIIGTSGGGAGFYQTVDSQATSLTQRPALNYSAAFSVTDDSTVGSTDIDLAVVNPNVGTFGSANQVPVITVNQYGQITSVGTAGVAGVGGGGTSLLNGTLAAIPTACSAGTLYFATDQPVGQQIYTCSNTNAWTQMEALGTSGALAITDGALDIVQGVVPRLDAANNFAGVNTFANGLLLQGTIAQPTCNSGTRGMFWFQNNGASKDGVQVCVFNGTAYAWISLY